MSEQVVDLRSSWAVVRRRTRLLTLAALFGALAGAGLFVAYPPLYSSTSIVLLPAVASVSADSAAYDAETQALIAGSSEVMGLAGEAVSPPLTTSQVEELVTVSAPSPSVLRFTASAETPAEAESLSAALADAHVSYLRSNASALTQALRDNLEVRETTLQRSLDALNDELKTTSSRLADEDRTSPEGRADAVAVAELTAQRAKTVLELDEIGKQLQGADGTTGTAVAGAASVIQSSSPAERSGLAERAILFVAGGALLAVLLTVTVLLARTRRDARLRSRDELAASVGIPVLASLASRAARSASGWADLLQGYTPGNIDGWALRQLLRQVAPRSGEEDDTRSSRVVLVLCLADDAGALAAAPQFATFAASTGVRTTLVAAQFNESASTLWAACTRGTDEAPLRKRLAVTTRSEPLPRTDLVVVLAVLDPSQPAPQVAALEGQEATTLLAVSAGAATAQALADVAVASDAAGYTIDGLLVTDPDPLDRTTGQLGFRGRRLPSAPVVDVSARAARPATVSEDARARRAKSRRRDRR